MKKSKPMKAGIKERLEAAKSPEEISLLMGELSNFKHTHHATIRRCNRIVESKLASFIKPPA